MLKGTPQGLVHGHKNLSWTICRTLILFFIAATSYTNLYNVLNFPAGVVPVTTVTQADEEELKQYEGHYGDPWDKRLKEVCMVA